MSVTRYVVDTYVEAGYYEVIVEPVRYVDVGYVESGYVVGPDFVVTSSISAELTELTNVDANGTLTSAFSLSSNIGLLQVLDASLDSAITLTTTANVTVSASADFGALFSPTFVVGAIKRIDATLSASISMNATISKFTGNEATLSNIISLSLQGIKQVDSNASPSASFSQSASATKTTNTSTALSSTFTLTSTPGNFINASAHITQNFILFTSKWPNRGRPVSWSKWSHDSSAGTSAYTGSNIVFSSSEKQYGTHSLQLKDTGLRVLSSELDIGYTTNNVFIPVINHNQNFVWEFWVKMENDNYSVTNNVVACIINNGSSVNLSTEYNSPSTLTAMLIGAKQDKITAKFREFGSGTFRELTGSTSSNNFGSGWHHIVLRRYSGNTVEFRVDNTQIDTYTYTGRIGGITSGITNYNRVSLQNWDQVPGSGDVFFDGLHFQLDSSTITGYSSNPAGSGTENTLVLANFDNNFDDDLGLTLEASATLEASGGVLSAIGGIFGVTANLTATTSLSANTEVLRTATATITSSTSVSATGLRIHDSGSITFNTASTVGVTAVKQATASSSANLAFTSQIDGGAVRNAIGDFDSIATQLTAVSKIGDFLIAADVTATLSTQPNITASGSGAITSAFSQTINETLFKIYSATLTSSFSQTTVNNLIVDPVANLVSAFTQSTSGDRIRFGVSSLDLVANLVVETNPIKNAIANLTSSFTQPAMAFTRIRPFVSTLSATATLLADGIKTVTPNIDAIQTTSTVNVTGRAIRDVIGDFDSIATQLIAAAKIGDFLIDADVVSSLTADGIKTTGNVIVIEATSTVSTNYGLIKQGASTQSSAFSVTAEGTSNITAEAVLPSTTTVSVSATKTIEASATLEGAGGFVVTAIATRNNEIIAISTTTLSADGDRIRFGNSQATSVISTQITAGKLVDIAVTINSSITISATVRVVNIDDIVYKIPAETKEYSIVLEAREHTIVKETREHTVT